MVVWATAALLVAAAHLALAKAVAMASHPAPVEAAEPALMIDLQPLPIATAEAVQSEAVAEVEPQETAEPVFEEEIAEEPLSREKAEAAAEPAEPDVQPEIIEEPEEKELELPEAVAVLPAERPAPTKPPPVDQPRLSKKPPVKPQAAKPRPQKPPSQASQQSRVSRAPTVSLERWQARVLAWINRYKRYPPGARARGEEGMVRVAFMIDGAGRVQSVRVHPFLGQCRARRSRFRDGAARLAGASAAAGDCPARHQAVAAGAVQPSLARGTRRIS